MAEPFLSEIRIMSFGFAAEGLGAVQRPAPADQPEPGAVLAAGDDLRRRRAGELRAAGPAGARADPRRQRPHARRAGRRAGAHALDLRDPDAHPRRASATSNGGNATPPTSNVCWPSAAATLYGPARRTSWRWRRRRSPTSAASRRTSNMQPFLTLNFCIALQGIFPQPELRRRAMAQPYVGEIRMFAGNFAPAGWMFCEGQLLPISENETLFQLIGTTYGGDGRVDLRPARPARPHPAAPGQRLHPGRDRRGRGDHADGQPDPGAHATRCWPRPPPQRRRPGGNVPGRSPVSINPYVHGRRRRQR